MVPSSIDCARCSLLIVAICAMSALEITRGYVQNPHHIDISPCNNSQGQVDVLVEGYELARGLKSALQVEAPAQDSHLGTKASAKPHFGKLIAALAA